MQANKARGEAVAHINGRPVRLVASLDALARLEAEWQSESLADLNKRLFPPKVSDMRAIIVAFSEAAGNPVPPEEIGKIAGGELLSAISAIAEALAPGERPEKKPPPPARKPARYPGKRG